MHDPNRNRHDLRRNKTGYKTSQKIGARNIAMVDDIVRAESGRRSARGMTKEEFSRKMMEDLHIC